MDAGLTATNRRRGFNYPRPLPRLTTKGMARILIIDDDPDMRAVLEQTLSAAGHDIVLAGDGQEGIDQYRAAPVDVVVIDLFMPRKEGIETIREMRRHFPETSIIAMSGDAIAVPLLSVAKRLGAARILKKPFHTEELLALVAELVCESRPV
jgi:DNA-binding response OmpR family regulator